MAEETLREWLATAKVPVHFEQRLAEVTKDGTRITGIRVEPVFMILGQSAASAACLAIDTKVPAQNVDYTALRAQLLKDGQVLAWPDRTVSPQASAPE